MNKTWNRTFQIEQSMQLYCSFGRSKWRPMEQTQAQVDCCGVQGINRYTHQRSQFHARRLVGVKRACRCNQMMRQIGEHLPGSDTIRIGQSIARNGFAAKAHVMRMFALGPQIDLDIAQRFASGQLCEGENQKLIQTTEFFDLMLRAPGGDHSTESLVGHVSHHLRKYKLPRMHRHLRQNSSAYDDLSSKLNSNRGLVP